MPSRNSCTFEQFTAIRRYGPGSTLSFAPDGSEIAYTVNTSGQFNLWRQSAHGGFPHQLTMYSEHAVRTVAWSPDGRWIAYNADYHGDEFYQIYVIPAQGGRPQQLTDAPDVQHHLSPHSWSPDGRTLAYFANDRDRTALNILVRDMKSGEVKRVLAGDAYYEFGRWSPDGKRIVAVDVKSNSNTDLYLVNLRDASSHLLTPHEGDAKYVPGPWAADGSGFYLLTDEGREFIGLAFFNLRQGRWDWVETAEWDIEQVDGSPDGRLLAWLVNENGYSRLYVRDLRTGKLIDLPGPSAGSGQCLPEGTFMTLTFSSNGDKLGLFVATPTHCAEIYVLDLPQRKLTQLTYSMLGGIDERDLVRPKNIRFPTFDGRKIPAFLYKPKGANAANKAPAILSIHGGPEYQERPMYLYSGMYQYWLSRGIGVLAPNIRGSTGYGKAYQKLIHHDWGGAELKDIEAAAQYLRSLDWVDPRRMGVFGGSFGGFATLSAVSRLPDYWAAAVDIVGPSNLVTLVQSVPPHWRRFMDAWVGNPEKEHDFLMERSPITYVDQIKAPLFIIQGANDPRVVQAESDQIVARLRARGVEVRYDVYEDEGHGFTKRENELRAFKSAAEFFERYLLPDGG